MLASIRSVCLQVLLGGLCLLRDELMLARGIASRRQARGCHFLALLQTELHAPGLLLRQQGSLSRR